LVIKNGSESCVGHETALALIFVLEEWLNQKSAVLDVGADSDHGGLQFILFLCSQLSLGIED
jgi:hypothetical protein